jgi:hypothetical protein
MLFQLSPHFIALRDCASDSSVAQPALPGDVMRLGPGGQDRAEIKEFRLGEIFFSVILLFNYHSLMICDRFAFASFFSSFRGGSRARGSGRGQRRCIRRGDAAERNGGK